MTLTFRSAVDTWFYLVIVSSAVALVVLAATVWQTGSLFALAVLTLSSLGAVGFPLWMLRSTVYSIGPEHLDVHCGPFHWRIRRDEIESVRPTRSPLSSPALSLDRLEIRYGAGRTILVSPADQAGFLRALG